MINSLNNLKIVDIFKSQSNQTRASILKFLSIVLFAFMVVFIRKASEDIHVLEVVFFRNLLAFIVMLPILKSAGLAAIKMKNTKLFFMRAFIGAIGMIAGFACLTLIPLAQAIAISFSQPLFITIGAAIFLGEIIKARRIAAIIVGIFGMLIIVQPGFTSFSFGIMLSIVAAVSLSINALIVKKLTVTDTPEAIIMWMVIMLIPITFVPAITVWQWPSFDTWLYLWGIAILATLAHFSWTKAYSMAEISSLEPIGFIKLPIIALLGWLIFSEIPGTSTWIGGLIIFISTIYISHRETKSANSLKPNDGAKEPRL